MNQGYTDFTSGAAHEFEPVRPVMPMDVVPAPVAAERVYERGSIAATLQSMFREADERASAGMYDYAPEFESEQRLKTPEAYRLFLESVQKKLKESDAVHHLQQASETGAEITAHDVEAVFRAYERALRETMKKLRQELTPQQLHNLQSAATSELDWGLRDMITQHVVANADVDVELRYDPTDFFLLLNPKARKIEYMESKEILGVLRRSMSRASKEQLHRDLDIVHRYEALPAVHDALANDEFSSFEQLTN